jgi:hypothetical protein
MNMNSRVQGVSEFEKRRGGKEYENANLFMIYDKQAECGGEEEAYSC